VSAARPHIVGGKKLSLPVLLTQLLALVHDFMESPTDFNELFDSPA